MHFSLARLGNVTLTHAVIRQAEQGVRGSADGVRIINTDILSCEQAVYLSGTSRQIDIDMLHLDDFVLHDSRVVYNEHGVFIVRAANENRHIYIASSIISHNEIGIFMERNRAQGRESEIFKTHVYVTDCHIEANSQHGISNEAQSSLIVERSSLIGPSEHAYYSNHNHNPLQVTFRDTYFTGFSYAAVHVSCVDCDTVSWSFYNNYFENIERQGLYISHAEPNTAYLNLDVVNNTFNGLTGSTYAIHITIGVTDRFVVENNTFHSSQGGIYVEGYYVNDASAVSLAGNRFINVGPNGHSIKTHAVTVYITGNLFENCTAPSLIHLQSRSDHVISENWFINNKVSICFIEVNPDNLFDRLSSIQANRNYWDTQDVHRIKDVICDFFLDSNRARVEMTEFYTSADMSTVVTRPDDFLYQVHPDQNTVVIGGVISPLTDTSIVTDHGYDILVNRSIIVEDGVTLNIHSLTMLFSEYRGVVVFGELMYYFTRTHS